MQFSLLKIEKPNKLKRLSKNKINFLNKKEEEISIFHFNKFDDSLFHVVLHISDEYQIGTKKLGKQFNYPYSSLVNMFFILNANYILLEHINDKYTSEVIEYINNSTKTQVIKLSINNDIIIKLHELFNGTIKKVEYTNEYDEMFELDYVTKNYFHEIASNNTIDLITLLVDNRFISLDRKGKITVDNSDENFLINFTKRILTSNVLG